MELVTRETGVLLLLPLKAFIFYCCDALMMTYRLLPLLLCICIRLHNAKAQEVVHVHSLSRKKSQVREVSEDGATKQENSSEPDANNLRFERIRIQNMDIK